MAAPVSKGGEAEPVQEIALTSGGRCDKARMRGIRRRPDVDLCAQYEHGRRITAAQKIPLESSNVSTEHGERLNVSEVRPKLSLEREHGKRVNVIKILNESKAELLRLQRMKEINDFLFILRPHSLNDGFISSSKNPAPLAAAA